MSYIVVDVESDGQAAGLYSMISFGAVVVRDGLEDTFYSEILKPISDSWSPDAMKVSGVTRMQMEYEGKDPHEVMVEFDKWILKVSKGKPIFISDNNGFDWQFVNYYFHKYVGRNPFGWSSRRIGDLYCGMVKDTFARWKHLRKTKHTHHPVDDAKGNAEALLMMKKLGLKISLR
jgi:DNA polymerase III epsilon subunit-like protein